MKKVIALVVNNPTIVGVIVALFFLSGFLKAFKKPEVEEMSEIGSTLTNGQARSVADKLFISMDKFGTDEDMIHQLLTGLTDADYGSIFNAFGLKQYASAWGTEGALLDPNLNLTQWLIKELNTKDLERLRANNPKLTIV